jgi:hypothetical protein
MIAVGEPEVGRWKTGWRLPAYGFLDDSVVALRTCSRLGPESLGLLQYPGMAAGAPGKQLTMLPVIETLLGLSVASLSQERDAQKSQKKDASPDHEPARGRVRSARGRGARSAPLPKSSVTRAFSRV